MLKNILNMYIIISVCVCVCDKQSEHTMLRNMLNMYINYYIISRCVSVSKAPGRLYFGYNHTNDVTGTVYFFEVWYSSGGTI